MSTTNPVNGTSSNIPAAGLSNTPANMQINQTDFLQLITAQMKDQNPLSPSDPPTRPPAPYSACCRAVHRLHRGNKNRDSDGMLLNRFQNGYRPLGGRHACGGHHRFQRPLVDGYC